MKFPPLSLVPLRRGLFLVLFAALVQGGAGCSSSEPPAALQVQPSQPGGPLAPGPLVGGPPAPGDGDGLPGPEPTSAPPDNEGPGATETNFLTPPCRADGDCPDGRRCVVGARAAALPDAGAPADAGASADAGDAGAADDAGIGLGFCALADAG
jgi:hypothetical protein